MIFTGDGFGDSDSAITLFCKGDGDASHEEDVDIYSMYDDGDTDGDGFGDGYSDEVSYLLAVCDD